MNPNKVIAILLLGLFLVSLSAGAVSASIYNFDGTVKTPGQIWLEHQQEMKPFNDWKIKHDYSFGPKP